MKEDVENYEEKGILSQSLPYLGLGIAAAHDFHGEH